MPEIARATPNGGNFFCPRRQDCNVDRNECFIRNLSKEDAETPALLILILRNQDTSESQAGSQ